MVCRIDPLAPPLRGNAFAAVPLMQQPACFAPN
jgi:hypothetical protein